MRGVRRDDATGKSGAVGGRQRGGGQRPAVLAGPTPVRPADAHRRAPLGNPSTRSLLATPGLVLIAAWAIFEGYRWLHLVPGGSLRPPGLLFVVVAVPLTWAVTAPAPAGRRSRAACAARAFAVLLAAWGVGAAIGLGPVDGRPFGVTSLALAASLLAAAGDGGRPTRR